MKTHHLVAVVFLSLHSFLGFSAPVESLTFAGQADTNQASFTLTGRLKGHGTEELEPKLIYSVHANTQVRFEKSAVVQESAVRANIFQGKLKELVLAMQGQGEVTNVQASGMQDWGMRVDGAGKKFLVIRPVDPGTNPPPKEFSASIVTRLPFKKLPLDFQPLSFVPENAALFDGTLELKPSDAVELSITNLSGLMLVRPETAVKANTPEPKLSPTQPLQFRFAGGAYALTVEARERDADIRKVNWEKFQLVGELKGQHASFTLTGEAVVRHPEGGTLAVLAGDAALTSQPPEAEMTFEQSRYLLRFAKAGVYPVTLKFDARVTTQDGWNSINFEVVASSLRPVRLKGLPGDTQFQFSSAAVPERQGDEFASFLPSAGRLQLQWKEAKREELGKLFYSVEGTVQMAVSPGLLRQAYVLDYRVMQGELNQLVFNLSGEGEVTRVRGNDILSWKIEPKGNARQLIVQLNQPCKDSYQVAIQAQMPLGAFPSTIKPLRLAPDQAIRYGGYLLAGNDGAVRLEVTEALELSQISPELFHTQKDLPEAALPRGSQAFAYRFSSGDYALTLQADNILPELSVSQMLVYSFGETETAIDAELELEIRDAPLREFVVRIPSDFTVSQLTVANLSDYFVTAEPGTGWSKLRMVFATPLTGRQLVQLRLGRNQNAKTGAWILPALQPQGAKSIRGYVGVLAETGFRLSAGPVSGLTDIATAFFPKKISGLQLAWRLREDAWTATVNVERLALTVQADVLHLFTLNEGLVSGSSVINYLISGAPVSTLKVAVPADYSNVEFAGKDLRNWKKVGDDYEVYLHTPAYGAYTLLATYDRQLNTRTNALACEGARPLDAQAEQGSVLVISDYQFEVKPAEAPKGLIQLDPAEVPPEHRLLFDSPILAAYQYAARPFSLKLALSSLPPGETMHQVADRAVLNSHISREGEIVTTARYYLKNQGHPHLRLTLPAKHTIWEARVNDKKVVPMTDGAETLVPLPPKNDACAILTVDLKIAAKSDDKTLVTVAAPALKSPVLQTEWQLVPDEQYRLEFTGGGVLPREAQQERSGLTWLQQLVDGGLGSEPQQKFIIAAFLLLLGAGVFRIANRAGTFRWTTANVAALATGVIACGIAIVLLGNLASHASALFRPLPAVLTMMAPIQQAGQTIAAQVKNLPLTSPTFRIWPAWPVLLAVALWIYLAVRGVRGGWRTVGTIAGWTLLSWGLLRLSQGAPLFLLVMILFVIMHLIVPALVAHSKLPPTPVPPDSAATGAAAALLMFSLLSAQAAPEPVIAPTLNENVTNLVRSVIQKAQTHDGFVSVQAELAWTVSAGQRLDFLAAPAVLTKVDYPHNALQLTESKAGTPAGCRLLAKEAGEFTVRFEYQIALPKDTAAGSFILPTPAALVNRFQLEVDRAETEIYSTNAVSVDSRRVKDRTQADLVLLPATGGHIAWKPRARDPRLEKPVFYAELQHLFIPTPGVIEGIHGVQVRPAQGQLAELAFQVPANLTITDVQADFVSIWRFDPDTKILRVQFKSPQAKPFGLKLRSQLASGTLPYERTVGVIAVNGAAGQLGLAGIATGTEVQLDAAKETAMSVINLEDFPASLIAEGACQIPGLTLRRAFRHTEAGAQLSIAASAVQPDVRVETQETLSLGEDRTVLASQMAVRITRAGIFKLSFVLPKDFEIEALNGAALSHWTESKSDQERVITLHLRGRTEGAQSFNVTLAGPGMGNRKEWAAPRLMLREAAKQTGQLIIVPEQGMRLHLKQRDGLSQLDPKKTGVQQKGVLAFRLLQANWQLGFDIESVEPWIQAATLQEVSVREGQANVTGNLDFQIENAGVKSLIVQVPADAENVRFEGELISDAVKQAATTNRWSDWEIRLQRRMIGGYALRLTYQQTIAAQAAEFKVAGINVKTANLQRGYLALRAGGRLQLKLARIPASLQPAEWQSIPNSLRRGRDLAEAKDTFSVLERDFDLAVGLSRHETAKLLPAQVESLTLTSVVAPSGQMLTEGRLQLQPGDKRLLHLRLPTASQFWYAFVNGQSAWPWRADGEILLLLEKNSTPGKPAVVEFFYTCSTTNATGGFSHQVLGPAFDLPLENITWNVYLPPAWHLKDWDSTLQLRTDRQVVDANQLVLDEYLRQETLRQQTQTKEAETLLQMGNDFLQKGAPQQARRAYHAAWKMSPQDAAFNEDARVQLNNLKLQQALIGLNQRRQSAFDYAEKKDGKPARTPFAGWEPGRVPDYTQQQAQQFLEQNSADDNTALYRLAERLVRQQIAGVSKPECIRAALPLQGQVCTFTGSLEVNPWADLRVKMEVGQAKGRSWSAGGLSVAGIFGMLLLLAVVARGRRSEN